MSSDSIFKTNWNDASETDTSYTRLSVSALLSVFFGLGTFLVFFTPWFFFLGVIAILLSLFSLWAIRNADGGLSGTKLAYMGLCSATVALVSIVLFWATYQHGIRQEADQFFRLWFAAVQKGDVPQAKEYQSLYSQRTKAENAEKWWEIQYGNKYTHRAIHHYVEDKLIRTLMALGDQATVSYYKTPLISSERESDKVVSIYAVTFPAESGGTKTFFVSISGERMFPDMHDFKAAGWKISNAPTFYLPDEFKKEGEIPR